MKNSIHFDLKFTLFIIYFLALTYFINDWKKVDAILLIMTMSTLILSILIFQNPGNNVFNLGKNTVGFFLSFMYPILFSKVFLPNSIAKRIFWWAILILVLVASLLDNCRGTWVVILLSSFLLLVLAKKYLYLLVIFIGGAVSLAVLILGHLLPKFLYARLNIDSFFSPNYDPNQERLRLWSATFKIVKHHLLTGIGFNNFPFVYPHYITGPVTRVYLAPHNMYFEVLVSSGILGLIAFIIMIIWLLKRGLSIMTDSLKQGDWKSVSIVLSFVMILIHSLVDSFLFSASGDFVIWTSIGLLTIIYNLKAKQNVHI